MTDIRLPGDKSIAHRLLILGALADGESRLRNMPSSLDVGRTLAGLRSLGADIEGGTDGELMIRGPVRWTSPSETVDCGNSGTSARLLTGLLAGLGLEAELTGDASLRRRPMDRVVYPLQAMGAHLSYVDRPDRLPLRTSRRASGGLRSLRYRPRVSSAQVRGALLLAAVTSRTDLEILDRGRPRDHTERLLAAMGAPVTVRRSDTGESVRLEAAGWSGPLQPFDVAIPGDISSAAFLIVARLLAGSRASVVDVGLNPSRAGFLAVLRQMDARVRSEVRETRAGEPVGNLTVEADALSPFEFGEEIVPGLVDEIPALVALASRVEGVSVVRGAAELRLKESDRIDLLVRNLHAVGVDCEELPDGLTIHGTRIPLRGAVRTGGDHRIAMAFGVLAAQPGNEITVDDSSCVEVSFPGFWNALEQSMAERKAG
jgi:3-phosphoshikimate 1-carboxyvinyltransferase